MDKVKVMRVIFCDKERRGTGVALDPVRRVDQIYDFKGNLLAESDPCIIYSLKDMTGFALFVAKEKWKTTDILTLFRKWEVMHDPR
jgi:hypothetical protein